MSNSRSTRSAPHATNERGPVWLSPLAAAARIGVSDRTIKRWIAASILPATRLPSPQGHGTPAYPP